jgi:S1-C subfamily serine protease
MRDDLNDSPASQSKTQRIWQRIRTLVRQALPVAIGILAAFAGLLLYALLYPAPTPLTPQEANDIAVDVLASATPPPAYSAQVYQVILPSLVYIQTRDENPADENDVGVGSGVVINTDGDILTAFHVVDGAAEIEVIFADGVHATAVIISAEPENDIAVLHPDRLPEIVVPAVLGNAGAMRVGDEAFAVGNPLGLAGSLSAGVISGFDRAFTPRDSEQRLEGLIQFDTAVNPGNSGGPLLNRYGQVIGIVTALANPSDQNFFIGIGFAVPIQTAVSAAGGPRY